MNLYIVRHGQSMAQTGLDKGTDPNLTEIGLMQADYLGKSLSDIHFDRIFASNLSRAIQTAVGVAKNQKGNIPIEIVPELAECGLDVNWEPDEKKQRGFYSDLIYHGKSIGNDYKNDYERAKKALEICAYSVAEEDTYRSGYEDHGDIVSNDKNVLIAAHGMFNAYLLSLLVNFPFDENVVIVQNNTCVNLLELYLHNGVKRVKFKNFNDVSHLKNTDLITWK